MEIDYGIENKKKIFHNNGQILRRIRISTSLWMD